MAPRATQNHSQRTILIVEDEFLIREDIAAAMREAGWRTLETGTGEGALRMLGAGEPVDLVFTDIQLGGNVSGWDVAEEFRASMPDIRIFYTSDLSRQVQDSLFIPKPYDSREVVRKAEQAV